MGKVLFGVALAIVVGIGALYAALSRGYFSVAASTPPDLVDHLAPWVVDRSVAKGSLGLVVHLPKDSAATARGLLHYRESCLPCHGAPGVRRAGFAQGLNPAPPELDSTDVQRSGDVGLFWIVKNGIRMTGMPAFGSSYSDAEIRDILAFTKHLPNLVAQEKELLRQAPPERRQE